MGLVAALALTGAGVCSADAAGTPVAASTNRASVQGNGWSSQPALSATGRYLAFTSEASNLVGDDSNGVSDVFWRDRTSGITRRVSISSTGVGGDAPSYDPAISADGQRVVFTSEATNLAPTNTNGDDPDVFVYNVATRRTVQVSVGMNGVHGNDWSYQPEISGNARYVVFTSWATNLIGSRDTNDDVDVFIHDLQLHRTTRVDVTTTGGQASRGCVSPVVNKDGTRVGFRCLSDLVPPVDQYFSEGIFVRDRTERVTHELRVFHDDGDPSNAATYGPYNMSADGRLLTYQWRSGYEVLWYDTYVMTLGGTTVASVTAEDERFHGVAVSPDGSRFTYSLVGQTLRNLKIGTEITTSVGAGEEEGATSRDGALVAFATTAAVTPSDTNATSDIYLWQPTTGRFWRASVG